MEYIGNKCFYKSKVEEIVFPAALREIGSSAFFFCKELKRVTFAPGSRLEKIGTCCFLGSSIAEVILPVSMREIGAGAFEGCEKLKSVQLNEGLEKLGA